jgi:putative ABC transport system permease protein
MINIETIKYSLRNLKQKKGRSFLTLFSILIGIATIFIFISFGLGLYNYIDDLSSSSSADKILILSKAGFGLDESFQLTDKDLEAVGDANGVYDEVGVYFTATGIKSHDQQKYSFLIAYDPRKESLVTEVFDLDILEGRGLRPGDKGKVVLGYNYLLPNKIFDKPLDLNDKVEIDGSEADIIGFYEPVGNPSDDAQIYISDDYFKELYPNKSYGEFVAKVDVDNIGSSIKSVERELRKSRGLEEGKEDFYVQSFDSLIESFSAALNIVIGFVILIALISIVVSAINTANTMITSVLERFREIGVMKAVGARNSDIFWVFLFESSFLGFVAGIIGVVIGWGFSSLLAVVLKGLGWGFLSPSFSPGLFLGCILFATLTGAISGAWPAWSASKINIVETLRYE